MGEGRRGCWKKWLGFFVSKRMFLLGDEVGIVTPVNKSLSKAQNHQRPRHCLAGSGFGIAMPWISKFRNGFPGWVLDMAIVLSASLTFDLSVSLTSKGIPCFRGEKSK